MNPSQSPNPAVAEWFAHRRLGLFLHFGLYAVEGWHEQDQMRRRIPREHYAKLATRFNPRRFDPEAILDLAQSAGMEYVCLTAKHHDGFCLWDTASTPFNSRNTPYKRDLVGLLAEACHRRGFPLGIYYSVVDWHHPNYPNQGRHHELPGPEPGDRPDWEAYMAYLKRHVEELATNYGEIRHWFWDMNVPQHQDPDINRRLRSLQPKIVINDRGFDSGDFGTPEREFPSSAIGPDGRYGRPTEACNSVGTQSWGFRRDEDYYTPSFLINSIDAVMARGGHFLLNVGPDGLGRIPAQSRAILRRIGDWYARTREAFGDAVPASDLTTNNTVWLTRRDRRLFVHVPCPARSDTVHLPPIARMPRTATLLNTGKPLASRIDLLPAYWQSGARILSIRGISPGRSAGETLIIQLEFDAPIEPLPAKDLTAFIG